MDKSEKDKKEKNFFKILQMIGIPNKDISIANKIYPYFYRYCKKLIDLYLNNRINSKKNDKKRLRNINYIIKYFFYKTIGKNNNKILSKAAHLSNTIFIHFFIFFYSLFKQVRTYKNYYPKW